MIFIIYSFQLLSSIEQNLKNINIELEFNKLNTTIEQSFIIYEKLLDGHEKYRLVSDKMTLCHLYPRPEDFYANVSVCLCWGRNQFLSATSSQGNGKESFGWSRLYLQQIIPTLTNAPICTLKVRQDISSNTKFLVPPLEQYKQNIHQRNHRCYVSFI